MNKFKSALIIAALIATALPVMAPAQTRQPP